jgi:hypothetical protein
MAEHVNCDTPNSASSEFIDHGPRENESTGHIFTGLILAMGIHRPISPTLSR